MSLFLSLLCLSDSFNLSLNSTTRQLGRGQREIRIMLLKKPPLAEIERYVEERFHDVTDTAYQGPLNILSELRRTRSSRRWFGYRTASQID